MQVKDYECKMCGSRDFVFKPKDEHITGIYCSSCGRWLKWADKKEKAAYNVAQPNTFNAPKPDKLKQLYSLALEINEMEELDVSIQKPLVSLLYALHDKLSV